MALLSILSISEPLPETCRKIFLQVNVIWNKNLLIISYRAGLEPAPTIQKHIIIHLNTTIILFLFLIDNYFVCLIITTLILISRIKRGGTVTVPAYVTVGVPAVQIYPASDEITLSRQYSDPLSKNCDSWAFRCILQYLPLSPGGFSLSLYPHL